MPPSERSPRAKAALGTELKVSVRTLENWQDEPDFRESWERRASDIIGSPERAHEVLCALHETAVNTNHRQHVSAAKLYLEATKAMRPAQLVEAKRPGELSDEELNAMLAQGVAHLQQERADAAD